MEHFSDQIFAVIHQIPCGNVTTYGEVAKFAGFPGYARQVGQLLSRLPADSRLPWHRVINAKGKISLEGDSFARQRSALLAEGVAVSAEGAVKLNQYRWQP